MAILACPRVFSSKVGDQKTEHGKTKYQTIRSWEQIADYGEEFPCTQIFQVFESCDRDLLEYWQEFSHAMEFFMFSFINGLPMICKFMTPEEFFVGTLDNHGSESSTNAPTAREKCSQLFEVDQSDAFSKNVPMAMLHAKTWATRNSSWFSICIRIQPCNEPKTGAGTRRCQTSYLPKPERQGEREELEVCLEWLAFPPGSRSSHWLNRWLPRRDDWR